MQVVSSKLNTVYNWLAKRLNSHKAIILLFLGLTVVYTWPLLPNINTQVTDQGDVYFVSWVMRTVGDKLRSGNLSDLWETNIFYPYTETLAFSDHSLTLALQSLPVMLLGGSEPLLANYLQMSSFFLAAVFAYCLAYYYTKDRFAAFIVGLIYGFAPFHVGQISHIQVASYQYIPLCLLFFEKLLQQNRKRNAVWFSLAFLANAFVSIYHLAFILIPLAIIALWRLLSREVKLSRAVVARLALAMAISGVVLLPLLIPYLHVSADHNVVRDLSEAYGGALDPIDLAVAPTSHSYWGGVSQHITTVMNGKGWVEHTLFLGLISMLVVVSGVFLLPKEKKQRRLFLLYLVIFIAGLVFALGPYAVVRGIYIPLPYRVLYELVPLFKGIRVPARMMVVILFGFALLVGLSIAMWRQKFSGKRLKVFTVSILMLIAFDQFSAPIFTAPPIPLNKDLYTWTSRNLPAAAVVVHYPFERENEYLRSNTIDHHRMFNGYSGLVPASTRKLMDSAHTPEFLAEPAEDLTVLSTLGVDYLIVHDDFMDKAAASELTRSLSGLNLPEVIAINNSHVWEIASLARPQLHQTATELNSVITNNQVLVTEEAGSLWVAQNLDYYLVKLEYLRNGQIVDSASVKTLRPLYLTAGESLETKINLPFKPLTNYDQVRADVTIETKVANFNQD